MSQPTKAPTYKERFFAQPVTLCPHEFARQLLIGTIEVGKLLLESADFGKVVEGDVGVVGMPFQVILMIVLGGIEGGEGNNFSDDRAAVDFGGGELRHVGLGDVL